MGKMFVTIERESRPIRALLRFAKIRLWGAALCGAVLLGGTPFLVVRAGDAQAPFIPHIAGLLAVVGLTCIVAAEFARRDALALQANLEDAKVNQFLRFADLAKRMRDTSTDASRRDGSLRRMA